MNPEPMLTVERVLAVMAHPDDVDFGSAGTIAQWTDAGVEVTYCIITDGDAGGFDAGVSRSQIGAIRRAEQTAAAKEVGVSDVRFLDYPDGRLEVSFDLRRDIARVIREVRPQRVVCQSPQRHMVRIPASHPDHLAAGEATLCAIYPDARNPFAFPELLQDEKLEPWSVPQLWIAGSPQPNEFTDVTDAFPRKVAALRAHASQTAQIDDLEGLLRGWMTRTAEVAGFAEGRLAEAFMTLTIR
jgi:LmbE family N-acetylglucosaminyl deacetylase